MDLGKINLSGKFSLLRFTVKATSGTTTILWKSGKYICTGLFLKILFLFSPSILKKFKFNLW